MNWKKLTLLALITLYSFGLNVFGYKKMDQNQLKELETKLEKKELTDKDKEELSNLSTSINNIFPSAKYWLDIAQNPSIVPTPLNYLELLETKHVRPDIEKIVQQLNQFDPTSAKHIRDQFQSIHNEPPLATAIQNLIDDLKNVQKAMKQALRPKQKLTSINQKLTSINQAEKETQAKKDSELKEAVYNRDLNRVRRLLGEGANPNVVLLTEALTEAARVDNLDMARFLLEKGADPNGTREDKWVPLYWAVRNVNLGMVHLLLDKGAQPGLEDLNEAKYRKDFTNNQYGRPVPAGSGTKVLEAIQNKMPKGK